MIKTKQEELICDRCGKAVLVEPKITIDYGKRPFDDQVRKVLLHLVGGSNIDWYKKPEGWVRIGGLDFCPKCSSELVQFIKEFFYKKVE